MAAADGAFFMPLIYINIAEITESPHSPLPPHPSPLPPSSLTLLLFILFSV